MKNTNEIATANITAQGQKLVDKYFAAVSKMNKTAWAAVKVVHDTVTAENFTKNFGSIRKYADAVSLSPSSVSLMNRAYILHTENERLEDFSYTATAAMLALPDSIGTDDFLDRYEIDSRTPVSTIKECIEELKKLECKPANDTDDTEDTEDVEETESAQETAQDEPESVSGEVVDTIEIVANEDVLYIGGRLWTLTPDDVKAIKEVMGL